MDARARRIVSAKLKGGCHCGAVGFGANASPIFVSNCHCAACRKATGAAFSTWVGFKADDVAWTKGSPAFYESSPGVERGYCSDCGTPLCYASDKWPGERHFLVGVFDDCAQFIPKSDAFPQEALSWAQKFQ